MDTLNNTITRQVGAEVLKNTRKYKSVSQSELARRLGVSQPLVSSWESGRITLGIKDIVAIEQVLELDEGSMLMQIAYPKVARNTEPTP